MDNDRQTLAQLEQELQKFPPAVQEEYVRGREKVVTILKAADVVTWARLGVAIAQQTVRSWEVAGEYFHTSPEVISLVPFDRFLAWARYGERLCQQSPPVALAYFRAGQHVAADMSADQLAAWASMGEGLYKGTWKTSIMAARFFETSPNLLRTMTFGDLARLVEVLDTLAHHSPDLALECLGLASELFPRVQDAREPLLRLMGTVVQRSWRESKASFEAAAKSLPKVGRERRAQFLRLAEQMTAAATPGQASIATFMQEASNSLSQLNPEAQKELLRMSEVLLTKRPQLLTDLFRSGPMVLTRLRPDQADTWFAQGLALLDENPDAGSAFFKLESTFSEQLMDSLSSSVELNKIKELLRMYCRALAGANVEISAASELAQKGIGWVDESHATTEGNTVYLPASVDMHVDKQDNFDWYKVVSTHQVAHLEFESFVFQYERPSIHFRDLRPKLEARAKPAPAQQKPAAAPSAKGKEGEEDGEVWVTDMQRFFDLFPERRMALDVYTLLEDGRLDARVKREYRGIRNAYQTAQLATLEGRKVDGLPAQEMLMEFLLRLSLDQRKGLTIPTKYKKEAQKIARIARRVFKLGSIVEDTAEGTIRIYAILSAIPNENVSAEDQEQYNDETSEEEQQETESEAQEALDQFQQAQEQSGEEQQQQQDQQQGQGQGQQQQYNSPQDVDFRGSFKPELVQLLNKLRQNQQDGEEQQQQQQPQISREQLQQFLENSVEMESGKGDASKSTALFANNLMREVGMGHQPNMPAMGQGPFVHQDDEGGPLESREPNSHVYDEWDFRAGDYKPRWCLVREKVVQEGEIAFWRQTLAAYAPLLTQIRRQFEMVIPEAFRRIKRQPDGEEFDLDATLEAMIDKRSGVTPSEKVYWRRNKVQRDVAVALLLDMSASTAEAVDDTTRMQDDWDGPNDPAEYMAWLRARRGEGGRRQHKRIIDIEKESTVLLMQALQLLDDKYGIYGFSGYGRENVEFSVIKEIDEQLTENVRRRIDRITPMHATRMGPAIRHVTRKLEQVEAKTKVLFLLSDGRPQDRGYSREGVEKEYAVHDTKKALMEAKRQGITPFCLTVDKSGHDYLKTMCQDMGYEVLDDIWALPERLPYLYRRLTV